MILIFFFGGKVACYRFIHCKDELSYGGKASAASDNEKKEKKGLEKGLVDFDQTLCIVYRSDLRII